MGKAYANKRPLDERPEADFYVTPRSLVWLLLDNEKIPLIESWKKRPNLFSRPTLKPSFYDPAVGNGDILKALEVRGYEGFGSDLRATEAGPQRDFLTEIDERYNPVKDILITNPPFSLFDEFVMQAKKVAPYFIFLGKMNFFGAVGRHRKGVWQHLKHVHCFSRQIDYRTPSREDGMFHLGNLITCWMVFDKTWDKPYWHTSILDVQNYANLGPFREES